MQFLLLHLKAELRLGIFIRSHGYLPASYPGASFNLLLGILAKRNGVMEK